MANGVADPALKWRILFTAVKRQRKTNTRGDVWSPAEYPLFYSSLFHFLIYMSFEFQLWIALQLTLIQDGIIWLSGIISMDDSHSFIQGQSNSNQCLLLRRGRIEFCQSIVKGGWSLPAIQWSHKPPYIPLGTYTPYLKYAERLVVTPNSASVNS